MWRSPVRKDATTTLYMPAGTSLNVCAAHIIGRIDRNQRTIDLSESSHARVEQNNFDLLSILDRCRIPSHADALGVSKSRHHDARRSGQFAGHGLGHGLGSRVTVDNGGAGTEHLVADFRVLTKTVMVLPSGASSLRRMEKVAMPSIVQIRRRPVSLTPLIWTRPVERTATREPCRLCVSVPVSVIAFLRGEG